MVGLLLTTILDSDSMHTWGWRIPFILGFLLGIISYIIRTKTAETPEFIALEKAKAMHAIPCLELMRTALRPLLAGFLITATPAALVSFLLYLPTYLSEILHYNIVSTYLVNLTNFCVFALMTAFSGWLSDKVGKRALMLGSAAFSIPLVYLLFSGLEVYGERFIWGFTIGFVSLGALFNGSYVVNIAESFSPALRYSGFAICHSQSLAILGGLAPLAFTGLIQLLGKVNAPYYYLFLCYLLSFCGALLLKPTPESIQLNLGGYKMLEDSKL